MEVYQSILDYVARYVDLSDEEVDIFTSLLKHKRLLRRQYLLQEGAICRTENFVIKGCLRAYYLDRQGKEHIVQFGIEDWWIADLHSFLTQKPATYHIQALEDSELLQLEYEALEELYRRVPKFERFFRIIIQRAFVAARQRVISLNSKTSEERYLEFREQYPDLERRVPQYMVASYLGFSSEFLSKIRKKWAEGG